jgi:hypothetical protein
MMYADDTYYTAEVVAELPPMRRLATMEPARQYAQQAGFSDISIAHVERRTPGR